MTRAPQKRRLETRARLLCVAEAQVSKHGYSGLRVEDVVEQAGVAKGTLFSHFKDKDGLLAVLIGAEVMRLLDEMEQQPGPQSLSDLLFLLEPLLSYVASDRVIFDLLLRYSGSTGADVDEVITEGFYRQISIWSCWIKPLQAQGIWRDDQEPDLLAEGIQALVNQVIAIGFCSGESRKAHPKEALAPFLSAWLEPIRAP